MRLLEEGVFPVRFLGFGFFWAWLFIAGLSPSPLFGSPLCVGGIPFELFELLMRCAMLAISLTLSCVIATDRGKYCFLALGAVAGIAVTPLLLWGGSEAANSVAALLTAMTEVSLFLMWLSFFGAMRLGDTLTLLVISYGVGALLFLVALMGGERTLLGASIVFPLLSAAALVFSSRLISRRGGTALFDNESTEPLKDEALSEETSIRNVTKSIPALKMTLALVCYSLAFSLLAAMAFSGSFALPASYLAEPVCIVVLAGVYILYAQFAKDAAKPYVLYRAVAPSMGLGFALLAISGGESIAGEGMVMIGYLLFEVLALNDYCNIVKANDASLFRTMAIGRLAISVGMLAGWTAGFFSGSVSVAALAVFGMTIVLITATLVFTDRDRMPLVSIADDRAISEDRDLRLDKSTALASFAAECKLSKRETEVFDYLIAGRTTSYVAGRLFVAESTVRAHVYNIYQKANVHSRMELMDAFDAFWAKHS